MLTLSFHFPIRQLSRSVNVGVFWSFYEANVFSALKGTVDFNFKTFRYFFAYLLIEYTMEASHNKDIHWMSAIGNSSRLESCSYVGKL
jgi:hypothetical protein